MSGAMEITTKVGCPLNCRACPQKLFVGRYVGGRGLNGAGQNSDTDILKESLERESESDWKTVTNPGKRKMVMSLEDFKVCIDKLPMDTQIDFSGFVEPQLNPAFVDMVKYVQSTGRKMTLFSTLVGMTKESYQEIREVPFVNMVLHIPDRDLNSHFVIDDNYLELVTMVIRDAMAGRFHIDKYSCHGPVHPSIAKLVEESGIPVDSNLHDRAGNSDAPGELSLSHKGKIRCSSGPDLDRNVLMPDGTVVLCGMDFGMDYVLGNLLTGSYEEIMNSPTLAHLGDCMKSEKNGDCICRHCVIAKNEWEYLKWKVREKVRSSHS